MNASFLFRVECDEPTYHPIWVRYEHLDYHAHCWSYSALRHTGLITTVAIAAARAIIAETPISIFRKVGAQ